MIFNYVHWNVDPEIIKFFGITLQYYGILFVSGLIIAVFFLEKLFKNDRVPRENLEKLIIYAAIGIFAGARLGHCLFYEPEYYLSHPLEMLFPIGPKEGGGYEFIGYRGLASHGGAIGLIIALIIYSLKTKQNIIKTLDYIGIVAPITGFFIRMGNLMNSEIIGKPATVPWAFIFERVDLLPRHPAQLYEAIAYLIIFCINWLLYKKIGTRKSNGLFFGLTLILIFTFRFFIEFLKERQVEFEEYMQLDMGQILSIPFVIVGIIFFIYGLSRFKSKK